MLVVDHQKDIVQQVSQILEGWQPISLKEMENVTLMNRQDTKYIFSAEKFPAILNQLSENYRVLSINDKRVVPYANVYFDNADLFFYHEHLRGKARRYKVRNRQYVDTQLSFTELKKKNNKNRQCPACGVSIGTQKESLKRHKKKCPKE